jgi:hypothetical protein
MEDSVKPTAIITNSTEFISIKSLCTKILIQHQRGAITERVNDNNNKHNNNNVNFTPWSFSRIAETGRGMFGKIRENFHKSNLERFLRPTQKYFLLDSLNST